jgi:hypothetical protein
MNVKRLNFENYENYEYDCHDGKKELYKPCY